jgi:hypothetical protein
MNGRVDPYVKPHFRFRGGQWEMVSGPHYFRAFRYAPLPVFVAELRDAREFGLRCDASFYEKVAQ